MSTVAPRMISVPIVQGTNCREDVEVPDEIQILQDGEIAQKGHFRMSIIDDEKGDERLTWDSTDFSQLKAAKKLFVDLVKKGLKPFRVGIKGKASSEVMAEFDPHAEEVIFLPFARVAGG